MNCSQWCQVQKSTEATGQLSTTTWLHFSSPIFPVESQEAKHFFSPHQLVQGPQIITSKIPLKIKSLKRNPWKMYFSITLFVFIQNTKSNLLKSPAHWAAVSSVCRCELRRPHPMLRCLHRHYRTLNTTSPLASIWISQCGLCGSWCHQHLFTASKARSFDSAPWAPQSTLLVLNCLPSLCLWLLSVPLLVEPKVFLLLCIFISPFGGSFSSKNRTCKISIFSVKNQIISIVTQKLPLKSILRL